MADSVGTIREIVSYDVDPDFLRSISIRLGWAYNTLFEELVNDPTLPHEMKLEEFGRRRGSCAVNAMISAAQEHGVPWGIRRLACNGQSKLLIKAGRVVIIQEPILTLDEHPRVSEYKRELARSHGLISQLELDLGDEPQRILDWSGKVLAVLLHGAAGPAFSERDRELGGLFLAVPDAAYSTWVLRLDLHQIAMFGSADIAAGEAASRETAQPDQVVVRLRNRKANTGTEE